VEGLPANIWPNNWPKGEGDAGSEPERRKPLPARLAMGLRSILEAERSRWFLWAPVILACGIAAYFSLPVEPPVWAVAILGLIAAFGLVILARGHGGLGVALISIFLLELWWPKCG
jgi:hypothetical protein